MKYLIVGLGNIGKQYEKTRHNVGFRVLDLIAQKHELSFTEDRHATLASLKLKGKQFYFIKPTTFMNLSGKAVNYHLQAHKIPLENLLVITDDISLNLGTLRLKGKGSAGGHNGLKDIEATAQSQEYSRLKIGVGANFMKGKQADYVLSDFNEDEETLLQIVLEKASEAVFSFANAGLANTMTSYNKDFSIIE